MNTYKKYLYLLIIMAIVGCGSNREATKPDSRYRREPIREVSEEQLKTDSRLIDAMGKKASDHIEEALADFTVLTRDVPDCAAAWYEMSLILANRNWTDSAMACAKRASELVPQNKWYLLNLAALHKQRGETKEAVAVWERLTQLEPDVLEHYYELSNACLDADDMAGAVDALNRVERRVGVTEPISLQKQRIWAAAGKLDKAEKELEKLADAMPGEKRYHAILAEMYMEQGRYAKAKKRYDQVLAADPNDPYIHIQLAEYHKKMGNLAEADSEMVKAFENPTLDGDTKLQLLSSFYTDEEFFGSHSNTTFRLLDMAMSQCKDKRQYSAFYGHVLLRQEKYAEAAHQMELAIQVDSTIYEVWELLLVSLTEVPERSEDLFAYSARAERLFPMQTLPKYLSAMGLARAERYGEALDKLKSAARWGYNHGYLEAECTALTAECAYQVGRYDEAWSSYDKYLKMVPDDWGVMNNYAYQLAVQGVRLEEALKMSEQTIKMQPDNPNNLDTYGWILHLLGRDAEAYPYLRRAVELDPESDVLRQHFNEVK